jgi:hypothetical protein
MLGERRCRIRAPAHVVEFGGSARIGGLVVAAAMLFGDARPAIGSAAARRPVPGVVAGMMAHERRCALCRSPSSQLTR